MAVEKVVSVIRKKVIKKGKKLSVFRNSESGEIVGGGAMVNGLHSRNFSLRPNAKVEEEKEGL